MKKTLILLLAVLLVVAFTMPASAFESVFGGYNRVRYYIQNNFTGDEDVASVDYPQIKLPAATDALGFPTVPTATATKKVNQWDTRTRLFYTAVFSDDFKFVNAFEFNVTFGDDNGGDVGTDGTGILRIKHSYADFRTGSLRWTTGLQGATLARGFLFADDFAGVIARYQPGTTGDMLIPVMFAKAVEGGATGAGANDDITLVAVYPYFPLGDGLNINPYLLYRWNNVGGDNDIYWLGVDVDMKLGEIGLWLSGIYNGGDFSDDVDVSGYLAAIGADMPLGGMGLSAQIFYASGDDNDDDTIDAFLPPEGASYYWAEIMGYGIFDNQVSAGAPADKISNILAAQIGVDLALTDDWALAADLWYAQLAEDNAAGDSDLGTEIDVVVTYNIIENLKLELVGAYLLAGDATGGGEDDPYELGLRTSFSF
jgi:hypothetical protein